MPSISKLASSAAEYISRTQILFSALLLPENPSLDIAPRDKLGYLLTYGIPNSVEQKFQPALELATPSPRFGMLLAASIGDR
jgi:conserved oligomeric Golgi complex subunit 1